MGAWADELARCRYERDQYKARATAKRKEWRALKVARRPLEALEAMGRMHEYSARARQLQQEVDNLKPRVATERAQSKQ